MKKIPPLYTAAAYAELNLAVLPLCGPGHNCATPGKIPFDFKTGQHMTCWQNRGVPTPAEIDRWLSHPLSSRANIGAVMGRASGVIRLDIDGENGEKLLAEISKGDIPPTWEFRSGRADGGRGLFFRYPERVEIISTPKAAGASGLEILSDGRQTVLPPSIHAKTGQPYAWLPGKSPWNFETPADAPKWLLRAGRPQEGPAMTADEWARLIASGATPGGRHPSLARLAGHLLGKKVDPVVVVELLTAWNEKRCRPPKPKREVVNIVKALWEKDRREKHCNQPRRNPWELSRQLNCSTAAADALIAGGEER